MRHAHFGGNTPNIAATGNRLAAPSRIGHGAPANQPTTIIGNSGGHVIPEGGRGQLSDGGRLIPDNGRHFEMTAIA